MELSREKKKKKKRAGVFYGCRRHHLMSYPCKPRRSRVLVAARNVPIFTARVIIAATDSIVTAAAAFGIVVALAPAAASHKLQREDTDTPATRVKHHLLFYLCLPP